MANPILMGCLAMGKTMLETIGKKLARFLSQEIQPDHSATCSPAMLRATLRKGDVLLVEGNSRFSSAIKYLTQSTWSHAALCIADGPDFNEAADYGGELLEADVVEGVRIIDLERYSHVHTRICRSVGLETAEINAVVQHALERLGHQYDLKNIFDLARYVITTPPRSHAMAASHAQLRQWRSHPGDLFLLDCRGLSVGELPHTTASAVSTG